MTKRNCKPHESPLLVSTLGLACLSLLSGCGGSSGGGGGSSGGNDDGPISITSANAQTLAAAALEIATIADSLPSSASHIGNAGGSVNCAPGTLEISASSGGSNDTITTPSGNVIAPPSPGDTVLDYDQCAEDGYEKSGRAAVTLSGGSERVRWMNLRLEHPLITTSNVVGAAMHTVGVMYRIDDMTVTQGSSSFYARGQIDFITANPRQLRFDIQLRFPDGAAQITAPQFMTGTPGQPFDGGQLLIAGDDSSVTVIPQGSGLYRLEIDIDGDNVADEIRDAVAL